MIRIGRLGRRSGSLAFWAVAGLSLLAAHDAVYLAQVGPGAELSQALRSAGHGYWGAASTVLLAIGLAAAAWTGWRLARLRRRAASLASAPRSPVSARFWRRLPAAWLRLFVIVAAGFTIQENVEHLLGHGHDHVLGIGALIGPQHPLALPVIGLITGLAAVIAAALRAVERELVTAIAAALAHLRRRAPRSLDRPPARLPGARIPLLARHGAGRAPPTLLTAQG